MCATKNTFNVIDNDGKNVICLSLPGYLNTTLQNSERSNNIILAANTRQLIKNLSGFQKEFSRDYNQIVKRYRKVDFVKNDVKIVGGYGKKH